MRFKGLCGSTRSSNVAIGVATVFVAASALVSLASDRDGAPAKTISDRTTFNWTLRGADMPADFEALAPDLPAARHTAALKL